MMNYKSFMVALLEESKKDEADFKAPIDPKGPLVQELLQWD